MCAIYKTVCFGAFSVLTIYLVVECLFPHYPRYINWRCSARALWSDLSERCRIVTLCRPAAPNQALLQAVLPYRSETKHFIGLLPSSWSTTYIQITPRDPNPHSGQGNPFNLEVPHHADQRAVLGSYQVLATNLLARKKGKAWHGMAGGKQKQHTRTSSNAKGVRSKFRAVWWQRLATVRCMYVAFVVSDICSTTCELCESTAGKKPSRRQQDKTRSVQPIGWVPASPA